jgi:hypothetical protein
MISNFEEITPALFPLGQVVATSAAVDTLSQEEMNAAIRRHASGDWGEVCEEDRETNEAALAEKGRLMSVYQTKDETKFWIITEWDRSVTTILLPDDY